MKQEFEQLVNLLNQAKQNFEYADFNYILTAVYQLKVAETAIDAYILENRNEEFTF